MGTTTTPSIRLHQWSVITEGDEHDDAQRVCTVCKMLDDKSTTPNSNWRHEGTSCIEPIPPQVTYDMLKAELRASHRTSNWMPRMYGHPGSLNFGYWVRGRRGAEFNPNVHMTGQEDPDRTGWGELLRYARVQLANPELFGKLKLQGQHTYSLNPDPPDDCGGGCCDDH